jgi:hypothetical protein
MVLLRITQSGSEVCLVSIFRIYFIQVRRGNSGKELILLMDEGSEVGKGKPSFFIMEASEGGSRYFLSHLYGGQVLVR